MSPETSETTSEVTSAAFYSLSFNETELTLALPGESRKRPFSYTIDLNSANSHANRSYSECSDATKPLPEQVIGWPPVTLYRKNVTNRGFKLVKVAVDGAPYMRKVDLESYAGYEQLQCGLMDIFSYFTVVTENVLNGKALVDLVNRIKYVSTYEDKDGDWMLVGDVPWKMFVQTCKRIRLMRRLEAINGVGSITSSKCSVSSC